MAGLLQTMEVARALGSDKPPPLNALGRSLLGEALLPKPVTTPFPRFELYLDDAMEWRWRYRASNYKIIADSGEGYKNYEDAQHGVRLMQACFGSPIHIGRD